MESAVALSVEECRDEDRRILEQVTGQSLMSGQAVILMAYDLEAVATDEGKLRVRRCFEEAVVSAFRDAGKSAKDPAIAAIVEDAMQSIVQHRRDN